MLNNFGLFIYNPLPSYFFFFIYIPTTSLLRNSIHSHHHLAAAAPSIKIAVSSPSLSLLLSATSSFPLQVHLCLPDYIGTALRDGLPCLLLRCPDPSCSTVLRHDMINMLASDDVKELYARYFLRSYIGYNPKANWCPSHGCKYAVLLVSGHNNSKVTCNCLYSFCWKCAKEAHQPVSYLTFCIWTIESLAQTENWLLFQLNVLVWESSGSHWKVYLTGIFCVHISLTLRG